MEEELEETSLRHRSGASRHHHQRRRAKKPPPPTTNYDDVFGGPPRHAVPFSGVPDDYSEVFGGVSVSCSIPFLDLPTAQMDGWDCASGDSVNGVDYTEVFGRCDFSDFAVPYEELFGRQNGDEGDIDMHFSPGNGRSSVKGRSGPQTIDPSAFIQEYSNEDNIPYLDDLDFSVSSSEIPKEYNTSYNKSSRAPAKELLHAPVSVPQPQTGFTFVVEPNKPLPEYLPVLTEDNSADENSAKPDLRSSANSQSISNREPVQLEVPFPGVTDVNLQARSANLPPTAPKFVLNERQKNNTFPKMDFVSNFSTETEQPQQEKLKTFLKSDSLPPNFDFVPNLKLDKREKPKLKSRPNAFSKSESLPPGFGSELDAFKEAMEFAQARLKTAKELHEKRREGKITELPLKKKHFKEENLEGSERDKPRVLRSISLASNFSKSREFMKVQGEVVAAQSTREWEKSGKWRSDAEFHELTSIVPTKERDDKIGSTGTESLVEANRESMKNNGLPQTEVGLSANLNADVNITENSELAGEVKYAESLKREEKTSIESFEILIGSQEPVVEIEKEAEENDTEAWKEDANVNPNVEERENTEELEAETGSKMKFGTETEEENSSRLDGEIKRQRKKEELEKESRREKEIKEEEEKERARKLEEEKERAHQLEEEKEMAHKLEEEKERKHILEEEKERKLQMGKGREEEERKERERIVAEEEERVENGRENKLRTLAEEREREIERKLEERKEEKMREKEMVQKLEEEKERERKLEEEIEKERERVRTLEEEREQERERARKLEEEKQREREMARKLEKEKERERKLEEEIEKERERVRKLEEEREQERERARKLEEEKQREREMARKLEKEKERERKLEEEIEKERERVRKLEEERELEREKVRKLQEERELERERVRKLEEEREQERERVRKLEEEREKERIEKERERKEREKMEQEKEQRERERIVKEREQKEMEKKLEEEKEKQRMEKEKEEIEKQKRIEKEREEKEVAMRLEAEMRRSERERAEETERMAKLQGEKAKDRKTYSRKSDEERERERRIKEKDRKTEGRKSDEEREKDRERKSDEERERERERRARKEREIEEREREEERKREREKDRLAMERATQERAERIAIERITAARQRAVENREKEEMNNRGGGEVPEKRRPKGEDEKKERDGERNAREARQRAERAAVERATAEARERAIEKAKAEAGKERDRLERYKSFNRISSQDHTQESHFKRTQSDSALTQGHGESALRHKARLERQQRTAERAAKALAEKNRRDIMAQREQAERDRIAEHLDAEVKRWSSGKEGNLRALLSTLQYILGQNSGWQPIHLTEVITAADVKKAYRKATLYVHPDKLQQRGASIQQKYICEKVFDLLKEAWNKFNSEER